MAALGNRPRGRGRGGRGDTAVPRGAGLVAGGARGDALGRKVSPGSTALGDARPATSARKPKAPSKGIGSQALPGPGGAQLESRVQSGAITQQQAQRTMQQRQTLAKALGPNWREKLTVGGKSFAQVNKQLKANPGNAKLAAIRKKLLDNRASVLTAARTKNKGEGEAAEGAKKKRGEGE